MQILPIIINDEGGQSFSTLALTTNVTILL